jgi:hypothetical protein
MHTETTISTRFKLNLSRNKDILTMGNKNAINALGSGSGGKSPTSHRGDPGSVPGQSMWDLWWTKWHWDRFFP